MSDVHDASYYAKCMMGGVLACGVTHAAICPLDIVKCRKQVINLSHYNATIFDSLNKLGASPKDFSDSHSMFLLGQPRDVQEHR